MYTKPSAAPAYVPEDKKKQWIEVFSSAFDKAKANAKGDKEAESSALSEANAVAGPDGGKAFFHTNDTFSKFMPMVKMEEQPDGSLYVYGLVTAELPDQDGEVCHYQSTAPYFRAMNEKFLKATSAVAGMETSIGPLREMHQLSAVGCGKTINFDEEKKTICMGFKVVDDDAIKKCRAGVYVGFSQGGHYVTTWDDKFNGKTYRFYTAEPGEVSLVDSPCLPEALIREMKTRQFSLVRADGKHEMRKFQIAGSAVEDAGTGPLLVKTITTEMRKVGTTNNGSPIYELNDQSAGSRIVEDLNHAETAQNLAKKKRIENWKFPITVLKMADVEKAGWLSPARIEMAKADGVVAWSIYGEVPDLGPLTKNKNGLIAADYAHVGDPEKPETWLFPIKTMDSVRTSLLLFRKAKLDEKDRPAAWDKIMTSAKALGFDVSAECQHIHHAWKLLSLGAYGGKLEKELWDVGQLSDVLCSLRWMQCSLFAEREIEGDDSTIPADLAGVIQNLSRIFLALAAEETQELLAALRGTGETKAMNESDLKKAHSVVSHIKQAKDMVKANLAAHGSPVDGMHKAHHDTMHGHLDQALSALKAATESGDLGKAKPAMACIKSAMDEQAAYCQKVGGMATSYQTDAGGILKAASATLDEPEAGTGKGAEEAEKARKLAEAETARKAAENAPVTKADLATAIGDAVTKAFTTVKEEVVAAATKAATDATETALAKLDPTFQVKGVQLMPRDPAEKTSTSRVNGGPATGI